MKSHENAIIGTNNSNPNAPKILTANITECFVKSKMIL